MALRKPKSIPEIPKVRKKTIDKALEAIPMKKEGGLEFHCSIYFKYNSKYKKQEYIFRIETEQLFSSLNYRVTTESRKQKNVIDIVILGLKADTTYATQPGPAVAEVIFQELYGEHTINVAKSDGSLNSVIIDLNVFKKEIKLVKEFIPEKENNRKFCSFKIADDMFTFGEKGLL